MIIFNNFLLSNKGHLIFKHLLLIESGILDILLDVKINKTLLTYFSITLLSNKYEFLFNLSKSLMINICFFILKCLFSIIGNK